MRARDAGQPVQGSVAREGMCTGDQCNADHDLCEGMCVQVWTSCRCLHWAV